MRAWVRALMLLLASSATGVVQAVVIEEVVATVNGDMITKTELEEREREVQETLYARLSGADLDEALAEFRRNLLRDMINEKMLFQRALRMGLDLEQVYQSSLDSIMQQNNITTKEELVRILEQQGLTVPEFRESVLKYNVPDIMINIEVRRKISVNESEIQEYYEEHRSEYSRPPTYTFREIALLRPDHSRDEAIEIADKVLAELAAGEDFMALVKQYSEAPSRDHAGLIQSVPPEEMSPEILDALKSIQPGEVSQPVVTARAVMVLKLEEVDAGGGEPLEDVRPKIEATLKQQKFESELDAYLNRLWEDAYIKITPKYEERYPTGHEK